MTAPEWQERSQEAAATRVDTARERQEAVATQYNADRDAEQKDEPAGHQTKTVKSKKSAG
jgi:hypothetical protein